MTTATLPQDEQDAALVQGELIDALFAAGSSGLPDQMARVHAALKHPDAEVREAAADVLVQYGGREALPHLRAALATAASLEEKAWLTEAIEFVAASGD